MSSLSRCSKQDDGGEEAQKGILSGLGAYLDLSRHAIGSVTGWREHARASCRRLRELAEAV